MKFVINTITDWNEPPRCRHQVATELSQKHAVVFIEKNKIGKPKIDIIKEHDNLLRVVPHWPIDGRIRTRIPGVNELYQGYLFKKLKTCELLNSQDNTHIINFDFTAYCLFHYFKDLKITYYCNDDFIGHGRYNNFLTRWYQSTIEKHIIKKSEVCVATSDYLYNKMKNLNENTHLVPLGAPSDIPGKYLKYKQKETSKPVKILYVGYMIESKFHVDWIKTIAEDQNLEFFLIGPADDSVRNTLIDYHNVHFLGPKTGNALYAELAEADVCICPYDTRKINNGTTPNKLWLYLALGKPVVITEIPNMQSWQFENDIIYRVRDIQSFKNGINLAFQNDREDLFQKRIQIADQNNWNYKISHYLDILARKNV